MPTRHLETAPSALQIARSGLGPKLALERGFGFLEGALVGTGGQVLPPAIAHDERDIRTLPGLLRLRRHTQRRVHNRTGGDPGEDALLVEQFTGPAHRITRTDRVTVRQHRFVVQLRDEALIQVAQSVYAF